MATFVINGTTINLNNDGMEINVESDGKVYITEGGFWPKPLNLDTESKSSKKILQVTGKIKMPTLVLENFGRVGTVKVIKTVSPKTVYSAFKKNGYVASIRNLGKSKFEVTRTE